MRILRSGHHAMAAMASRDCGSREDCVCEIVRWLVDGG